MRNENNSMVDRGCAVLLAHRGLEGWPEAHLDDAFRVAVGRPPNKGDSYDIMLAGAMLSAAGVED